ncbi:8112_t:CDS:2 [Ambispora gerdemannii]|uniref:8112_t:CDS:1 n=1 Tax=Ambispora gerdemannii TaxID=144530 RepID=A0A9N8UZX9_9GLOM|nr:8112_t:CDS:2 [Ambispora gerdemannii]
MEIDHISDNKSSPNKIDIEEERKGRSLSTTTTTFTTNTTTNANAPRTWFRRNRVLRLENLDPNGTRQDIQASFEKRGFSSTWVDHTKDSTSGYARLNVPQAKQVAALIMAGGGLKVGSEIVRIRALEGEEEDSYWALAIDRDYSNVSKRLLRQHISLKPKVRIPVSSLRKRFVLSSSPSGGTASLEEDSGAQHKKKAKSSKGLRFVPYTTTDDDDITPLQDDSGGDSSTANTTVAHREQSDGGINDKNSISFDAIDGVDCAVQSLSSLNSTAIMSTNRDVHGTTAPTNSLKAESAEEIVAKFEKLYLDGW